MRVRLRWTDDNPVPHSTKIYRSNTEPTSNPTGEPLVTLTNGETVWDDTTVVRGATYWYTFVVTNDTYTVYSVPVQVVANPRTGAGPQEVVWGDQDWGCYGTIDETALITNARLFSLWSIGGNVNPTANVWNKMIRNGKTLFVPRRAVSYNTSWNNLYVRGLVHGVAGPGPQNGGQTNKEQRTVIQIGADEYIVRLPTGFDDTNNPTRVLPAGLTASNAGPYRKNSEMADLIWSWINLMPVDRTKAMNGYNGMWIAPNSSGLYSTASGSQPICQEIDPVAKNTYTANGFSSNSDMLPFVNSTAIGLGNGSNSSGWWPILELIETVEVVL